MRTATITTSSGHTWTTDINGTDESICDYFLGEWFDVEPYPSERKEQAVSVTIDGKSYQSTARRGEWITKYLVGSCSIPQTHTTSRKRWFLDVCVTNGDGGFCRDTLRVFDTRDECIAEYVRRCPDRCVPLNLEHESGESCDFVDTMSL